MNSSSELDQFLHRWRRHLGDKDTRDAFWEGPAAYEELKRHDYLVRVRLEERDNTAGEGLHHFIAEHVIPQVCTELKNYKANINLVRDKIEQEKSYEEWLVDQIKVFDTKSQRIILQAPDLAAGLTQIKAKLELLLRTLRFNQRQRWRYPLGASGLLFDKSDQSDVEQVKDLQQERELDGRFQVRLAKIFRVYLREEYGISLRTIARLIVLFLYCAELGEEPGPDGGDGIKLNHNGRLVSVANVIQKLRRAGVNKLT